MEKVLVIHRTPPPISPHASTVADAAPLAWHKSEGKHPIDWETFLTKKLIPAIDALEPRYENDFQVFWFGHPKYWNHPVKKESIRRDFTRARILYELLRDGGLWGFQFIIPDRQRLNRPPFFLRQMTANSEKNAGKPDTPLFQGDCDDSALLYCELAAAMGLKCEVKFSANFHVNNFVRIGEELIRLDLTHLSGGWNIGDNPYEIQKGSVEETHNRKILEPHNKMYREGRQLYAKDLSRIYLSEKVSIDLLGRMAPPALLASQQNLVPKRWEGFLKGYRHARECYEKFIKPDTFTNIDDAFKKIDDSGLIANQQNDKRMYFGCLEAVTQPTEKFGSMAGYLYWARGVLPASEVIEPPSDWLGNPFPNSANVHPGNGDLAPEEREQIQVHLRALNDLDPNTLTYPTSPSSLGAWLLWFQKDFARKNSNAVPALKDLIHLTEEHPSFVDH